MLAFFLAASCAEIAPERKPVMPIANGCATVADCGAYPGSTCDAALRICREPEPPTLDVTYLVSFPTTAFPGAGYTLAIPRRQLLASGRTRCVHPGACVSVTRDMTGIGVVTAGYQVAGDVAVRVYGPLQNRGGSTTLPVRGVFRPLSPVGASTALASSLRIPLSPIVTESVEIGGAPPGPFDSTSIGFSVTLPRGRYLRSLEPLPPFDATFPPVNDVVDVGVDPVGAAVQTVSEWGAPAHAFTLDSDEDLSGWRLYFRDQLTGRRISNVFSPKLGQNEVKLFTAGTGGLTGVDTVLEPPPGSRLPSLVSLVIAVPGPEQMPLLPPQERVSGLVVGNPEGAPLAASLLFRSVVDDNDVSQLEPVGKKLRYTEEVHTDARGAFTTDLPPGLYDVAIVPALESGFATRVARISARRGGGGAGLGLSVVRLETVTGRVTLADESPLVGATVRVAQSLVTSGTPSPFASLARGRSTVTDADGAFVLAVDPGIYDLVVEPPRGTRWPVTTLSGIDVPVPPPEGGEPVRVPPIVLGAPLDLGFSLINGDSGRPVSGAVVRAYAVSPSRALPVELAWGTTDRTGRVDLYASLPP